MKTRLSALRRTAALLMLSGALAGCVTPQVETPQGAPMDATALGLHGAAVAPAADQWWHGFGDRQLDALVDDALRANPSLAQAMARIRSAEARSLAAGAQARPSISLDADETRQRFSANSYIPPPYGGHVFWSGQVGINLNWNLDFWGRQAALIHQTEASVEASRLDLQSARLALAGAIAQAYVDLDRAWEMSDVAQRSIAQREQLLRLTRQRINAGLDTQIELKVAQAAVPQAKAALLQAQAARELAIHRLAALAGYGTDRYAQFKRPTVKLNTVLPLPDTLPIDLLARRPDLLAARLRVESATAGREAARAAFYPDVNLKAFIGLQAIGLDRLLDSDATIYGVGPALHLPIFEVRHLRAGYKAATAELDTAVADYNAAVLDAVRQSADQISLGDSFNKQIAATEATLESATAAHALAQQRYAAGLSTQLVVLNAESQMLAARRDLIGLNAQLAMARVTLLLTLGGSFDPAHSAALLSGASS